MHVSHIYGSYVQATIVLFSISVLSDYLGSLTSLYAVIAGDHTVIQCCQSKRHHGFSYMAVNGCFASYSFPYQPLVVLPPHHHLLSGWKHRAQSLSQ